MTFSRKQVCRKTKFPDFFQKKKTLFTRFEKLFLTPPQTANLHQAGVICGPSQNLYDGVKKFRKNTVVSEKMGIKIFLWGQFAPQWEESCRKEKLCRIWEQ